MKTTDASEKSFQGGKLRLAETLFGKGDAAKRLAENPQLWSEVKGWVSAFAVAARALAADSEEWNYHEDRERQEAVKGATSFPAYVVEEAVKAVVATGTGSSYESVLDPTYKENFSIPSPFVVEMPVAVAPSNLHTLMEALSINLERAADVVSRAAVSARAMDKADAKTAKDLTLQGVSGSILDTLSANERAAAVQMSMWRAERVEDMDAKTFGAAVSKCVMQAAERAAIDRCRGRANDTAESARAAVTNMRDFSAHLLGISEQASLMQLPAPLIECMKAICSADTSRGSVYTRLTNTVSDALRRSAQEPSLGR